MSYRTSCFALFLLMLITGSVACLAAEDSPVLINNVFVDTHIKTALGDLALASGYTIIPDTELDGYVSVDLQDVPFEDALYRVVVGAGLVYKEISPGVYLVGSSDPSSPTFDTLADTEVVELDYSTAEEIWAQIPLHRQTYVRQGLDQLVVTAPEPLLSQIVELIRRLDKAAVQVIIEVVVLEVTEEAAKDLSFEAFVGEGRTLDEIGGGTTQTIFDTLGALQTGEAIYTLGRIRGKIGEVEVGINALVEHGDAKIHANPRILAFEGHTAELQAGSDVYVTILSGPVTYQYAQLEEVTVGTIVRVTPHVSASGEITLEIEPEVSGIVDRGNRQATNVDLEVTVRRASTQARVQSGDTIIIGGLLQELYSQSRSKVPLLGDLPLIGGLFRSTQENRTRTELLILITPYLYSEEVAMEPGCESMQDLLEETAPCPEDEALAAAVTAPLQVSADGGMPALQVIPGTVALEEYRTTATGRRYRVLTPEEREQVLEQWKREAEERRQANAAVQ
jgi:type II secretory pathway component GspD/PulD (secretin)